MVHSLQPRRRIFSLGPRRAAIIGCFVALVSAIGCTHPSASDDPIIAEYRGGNISASELDSWVAFRRPENPRTKPDPSIDVESAVRDLALVRYLGEAARNLGLDNERTVQLALQLVEDQQYATLWRKHIVRDVGVSSSEVASVLAENPQAFFTPTRYRLRNLYKSFPNDATEADRQRIRKRMEEIRTLLLSGADMADLARAESESATRYRGGRMGTIEEDKLPDALEAVVRTMSPGGVSEVLQTGNGLTILTCDAVIPAKRPGRDEQLSKIETNLLRNKRRDAIQTATVRLLDDADLEIFADRALDPMGLPGDVVATYRSGSVDRAALELTTGPRPQKRPVKAMTEDQLRSRVEELVVVRLAAAEALVLGLSDSDLASRVKNAQMSILANKEIRRRVEERFEDPTDNEVREYFEDHRSEFRNPAELDYMAIRIAFDDGTVVDAHDRARRALDAVHSQQLSFEEAVRRFSDGGTNGAPLTETVLSTRFAGYGPSVDAAVKTLEPGQVSGLIRQDDRFWIIKLIDRRPPHAMEFGEARDLARRRLGQQRVDSLTNRIESDILASLEVTLIRESGP